MTCGSCATRVERALDNVVGAGRAKVNLATEMATVAAASSAASSAQDLIQAVRSAGFEAEFVPSGSLRNSHRDRDRAAQRRVQRHDLVLAIGLAVPVIVLHHLAPPISEWIGTTHIWAHTLQGGFCALLLASHPGRVILAGGLRAARYRTPNMDLLVSLGVIVAFASSALALLTSGTTFYFEAAAMIVAFITIGRYLEAGARREASHAVAALAQRLPATAMLLKDGAWQGVPVAEVAVGGQVRVAQDVIVPVDGRVLSGSAAVDESAVTGEPVPRACGEGDMVRAGTLVREGSITIQATAVGEASTVGRILRAVEEAQSGKTRMQRIADRVAGAFVPVVVALAVATFLGWTLAGWLGWIETDATSNTIGWAIRCAVAVLVIACPCAMGLATPTAVLVATGTAAARGILVRDAAALEAAGTVDAILLDKTGTVTTGQAAVTDVFDEPVGPITESPHQVLEWAASAEQFSQHPLAKAIVAKARQDGIALRDPAEFANDPGLGIQATIDGRPVLVGSWALLAKHGVNLAPVEARADRMSADGKTVVLLAIDGVCAGLIGLADAPRPGAGSAIARLADLGLQPALVTGDQAATATAVAAALGIKEVRAQMLPEDKLAEVRRRQEAGQRVAFVGDGINDAPALAAADVGMAFATGTDVAIESADITLLRSDLSLIGDAVELARRSVAIIKQNLFWAFFYNVVAIPLAATGKIPPGWAAAAMMCSSISVVLNSLRLRDKNRQNGTTST